MLIVDLQLVTSDMRLPVFSGTHEDSAIAIGPSLVIAFQDVVGKDAIAAQVTGIAGVGNQRALGYPPLGFAFLSPTEQRFAVEQQDPPIGDFFGRERIDLGVESPGGED